MAMMLPTRPSVVMNAVVGSVFPMAYWLGFVMRTWHGVDIWSPDYFMQAICLGPREDGV